MHRRRVRREATGPFGLDHAYSDILRTARGRATSRLGSASPMVLNTIGHRRALSSRGASFPFSKPQRAVFSAPFKSFAVSGRQPIRSETAYSSEMPAAYEIPPISRAACRRRSCLMPSDADVTQRSVVLITCSASGLNVPVARGGIGFAAGSGLWISVRTASRAMVPAAHAGGRGYRRRTTTLRILSSPLVSMP